MNNILPKNLDNDLNILYYGVNYTSAIEKYFKACHPKKYIFDKGTCYEIIIKAYNKGLILKIICIDPLEIMDITDVITQCQFYYEPQVNQILPNDTIKGIFNLFDDHELNECITKHWGISANIFGSYKMSLKNIKVEFIPYYKKKLILL